MHEQRRSKRFELKLPFELLRAGARPVRHNGETRNVSSAGVLFTADSSMEVGSHIEYIITLPATAGSREEVRLRCSGKVIRLDAEESAEVETSNGPVVAATLERYEFVRRRV